MRTFTRLMVSGAVALTVLSGALAATPAGAEQRNNTSTASAVETNRPLAATDAGVQASPKCSGTSSYGPFRYQVCVRYNCDSNSCFHRGYIGLINTDDVARGINYNLWWAVTGTPWILEHSDYVRLAPGQQITIYAPQPPFLEASCNIWVGRALEIYYSSGTSPTIAVSDYMPCR